MAPVLNIPMTVFVDRISEFYELDQVFSMLGIDPREVLMCYEDIIAERHTLFSDALTEMDYAEENEGDET